MKTLAAFLSILVLSWAQEETKLTKANNRFGLRLLRTLPSGPEENVFFSPYSVSTAMGMAFAGARGQTQQELSQGLGFSDADLTDAAVLDAYTHHTERLKSTPSNSTLDVANAAAIQRTLALLNSYESALQSSFGAELHKVDFAGEPQAAVNLVNNWVKRKTHDKIEKLFNEPLDQDTLLVLLNAIYFKGDWGTAFNKEHTEKRQFLNGGVTPVEVDTMRLEARIKYRFFDDLQVEVVQLPYRGLDYTMAILLPKENTGVEGLKQNLTIDRFQNYLSDLRERKITVLLPKFKLETKYSLKTPLQSLGIKQIFEPGADLSGINDESLRVSAVEHKAVVEVNEEGTEAAAATGLVIVPYSLGPEPVVFRVDHPFLFFIRNTRTDDIFFMGQVNKL
uniref:Putative serine proteinase inhibitor n=1 Tax=Ixodes scapularis TaxID=6945 RepID=A0A4D5RGN0_IXOSC